MKRTFSSISGTPVHFDAQEKILGRVNGVFMHPETGQIIAFLVGFASVLSPVDIEKWHRDSLQIRNSDALANPRDIFRLEQFGLKRTFLNSKRVISKSGSKLGRVRDFTFDTRTSSILTFQVAKKFLWIPYQERIFSYKDVSEVTDKAIILAVDPEAHSRADAPTKAARKRRRLLAAS